MLTEAVLPRGRNVHAPQRPASPVLTNLGPLGQLIGARMHSSVLCSELLNVRGTPSTGLRIGNPRMRGMSLPSKNAA